MKRIDHSETILNLFRNKPEVSSSEIKAAMPDLPEQTVFSRIRAMERKGIIYRCGKGLYAIGAKPAYKASISPKMLEINNLLIREFVGTNHCISSYDGSTILIETDKQMVAALLVFLRTRYPGVFEMKEVLRLAEIPEGAIVVKARISDSPLLDMEGVKTPSLEKKLVDLIADNRFFRFDDHQIQKEFQRAFEVYPIHSDRLLRYAGRRGVAEEVREKISLINPERVAVISTIQQTLRTQPVLRAWLFGSWSRQEERPDSDIDLLVDFDRSQKISLMDYAGYMLDIADATGKSIDYVENGHLLPFAAKTANIDKYIIYERSA